MEVARAMTGRLAPTAIPPVTILEGPRMSGKTFIVRKLVAGGVWGGYETLADPDTLALARHDLRGWLGSLPAAAVIDEAQLLADLPLAVKFLVDEPDAERRFLLTGSARLGRDSLGGSDPLTGRARRWRLAPLTMAELNGAPERMTALVGDLFSGAVIADAPALDISATLDRGGFPTLALHDLPRTEADAWVRDTTLGLLTDSVLPDDRFDAGLALRVLDAILRNPGGILNVASLGARTGLDPRTVDRYLEVCERRFLIHFLPNYATNPVRQSRARSKVHPVDVAFAAASLRRADPQSVLQSPTRGQLFESWVVNQIVPALQFADTGVSAFYWRRAKDDAEVDLLLVDDAGRRVALDVKSSTSVGHDDAKRLRALASSHPLEQAYVVYAGDHAIRLGDRCHALPAGALGGSR